MGIAVAVGIAVIIGAIGFQIYDSSYQRTTVEEYYKSDHSDGQSVKGVVYPDNPQVLHGLIINKDKYLLGENIFIKIQNIPMGLKDAVQFFTPGGKLFLNLEFDGDKKSGFKHYFKPSLMKALPGQRDANLCEKEDLIGQWTVIFRGLPDEKLYFEIMEETLPYSENYYLGCNENPLQVPQIEPSLGQ
jgi:hypothetical protein